MAKGRKRKAAAGDVASNRQASYRYSLLEQADIYACGHKHTWAINEGENAQRQFIYWLIRAVMVRTNWLRRLGEARRSCGNSRAMAGSRPLASRPPEGVSALYSMTCQSPRSSSRQSKRP